MFLSLVGVVVRTLEPGGTRRKRRNQGRERGRHFYYCGNVFLPPEANILLSISYMIGIVLSTADKSEWNRIIPCSLESFSYGEEK